MLTASAFVRIARNPARIGVYIAANSAQIPKQVSGQRAKFIPQAAFQLLRHLTDLPQLL
jgi:hypothetical protein